MGTNSTKYGIVAFFLFAVILFSTCKKNKPTSVKGTVVDATTSTGIANATAYLQQRDVNCFSCQPSTIATYQADASGYFGFNVDGQKGYAYSVVASATNYFNNFGTGGATIDEHTANTITVALKPVGWLKLHLKNTSPFDGNDVIDVGNSFVNGGGGAFYGSTIDTILVGQVFGNSNNQVIWGVEKNGIFQTPQSATVYCPRFDTTFYNINY